MNYYKPMLERYKECIGDDGEHIWGLDREVIDAFAAWMWDHYNKDDLLTRANTLRYIGTDDEKLEALARLDHDNLAINAEIVAKEDAPKEYGEEWQDLPYLIETKHYIIIKLKLEG